MRRLLRWLRGCEHVWVPDESVALDGYTVTFWVCIHCPARLADSS